MLHTLQVSFLSPTDTLAPWSGTQQRHESEAAPKTPGRQGLELSLSPQASRTQGRRRGRSALRRITVLASRVNWHWAMVMCVCISGHFVLDSSLGVNCIIPVVLSKTSHSVDETWGERGSSWGESHRDSQAHVDAWGWTYYRINCRKMQTGSLETLSEILSQSPSESPTCK